MFRISDTALIRSSGHTVQVLGPGGGRSWRCVDATGVELMLGEEDLQMAHPTVLATISARNLSHEQYAVEHANDFGDPVAVLKRLNLSSAFRDKAVSDYKGHWENGERALKEKDVLRVLLARFNDEDVDALLQASKTGAALDYFISLGGASGFMHNCPFCGQDIKLETNGVSIRVAGDLCPYSAGMPATEWELNVPSGKLVIANDLRDWFPRTDDDDFDVNTYEGCRRTSLAYADVGMAHACVGNSCPGVYKLPGGRYKIANRPAKTRRGAENPPKFEGQSVASICTDLWWYSICDADEFASRCAHFKLTAGNADAKIIQVKPGVYKFSHNEKANRDGEGSGDEIVYSTFDWVREPDPVKDFLAAHDEANVNARAFVEAKAKKWPTLYGSGWDTMTPEQRVSCWQRVLDHTLCTIGNGVNWHEKGFPTARVGKDIPDESPPKFRAQYRWYPMSEGYSAICNAAGIPAQYHGRCDVTRLTDSWARAAFEILESIISFGMEVRNGERCREVTHTRQRMHLALKCYRMLAEKHPNIADPEYVAWLLDGDRADCWVNTFDLGPTMTDTHREHIARQRWFPTDAYGVEFDARKLEGGHFTRHPSVGACWARKKDAQRFAIQAWSDNRQEGDDNCFWTAHAGNTSIPLYAVGRVIRLGAVSHMGQTLVEVAFDYGTPWMQGLERKAFLEMEHKDALRPLSKEEYHNLFTAAQQFYNDGEAEIKRLADR